LRVARDRLSGRLGRPPEHHELAESMGLSQEKYAKFLRAADAARMVSLERPVGSAEEGMDACQSDLLADERVEAPGRRLESADLRTLLTKGLSRDERTVLILYYYEEMTMKEIGAVLGMSESRISQLHSETMTNLRYRMEGREDEFLPKQPWRASW
jgi:RNA polymerase sigma factor for flagellar operon FliA